MRRRQNLLRTLLRDVRDKAADARLVSELRHDNAKDGKERCPHWLSKKSLHLTRQAQPPLAGASVANIQNCFIKSNADVTAASVWLKRLVSTLAHYPSSEY